MRRRHAHTQRSQHAHVPPRRGIQLLPHLPRQAHEPLRPATPGARRGLGRHGRGNRNGGGRGRDLRAFALGHVRTVGEARTVRASYAYASDSSWGWRFDRQACPGDVAAWLPLPQDGRQNRIPHLPGTRRAQQCAGGLGGHRGPARHGGRRCPLAGNHSRGHLLHARIRCGGRSHDARGPGVRCASPRPRASHGKPVRCRRHDHHDLHRRTHVRARAFCVRGLHARRSSARAGLLGTAHRAFRRTALRGGHRRHGRPARSR